MLPYETIVSVVKAGSAAVVAEIPWHHRMFISKIAVARTAGSGEVSVELFELDPTTLSAATLEPLYRVTDSATTSSGVSVQFFNYPRFFFSHAPLDNNNQKSGTLYVRLGTTGTGTYSICVGGFSAMT